MDRTPQLDILRRLEPDAATADLLGRFAATGDPDAFAALVRRYARLVFGVCRRAAGHRQDAEDAFQAVFLVLARKAGSVNRPDALGSWLHGVAARVARRVRRSAARRRVHEVQADTPEPAVLPPEPATDLSPVLDEELAALPARCRAAVVLCDLQGLTRAAAASALGVPEGTVGGRLRLGRRLLAERLTRRGVVLPAGGLAAALVAPPEKLIAAAAAMAECVTAGVGVSGPVRELAREGLPMKAWLGSVAVVLAAGLAVVAGARPDPPTPPPANPTPVAVVADPVQPLAPKKAEAQLPIRPRITQRTEMGFHATFAGWSADGRRVAVLGAGKVKLFETDTLISRGELYVGHRAKVVGFTRDAPALVVYRGRFGELTSEDEVQFWPVPKAADQIVPPRTITLDDDAGRPVAVLPDGKAVVTARYVVGRTPDGAKDATSTVYLLVDAATGAVVREVGRVGGFAHHAVTADGAALVAVVRTRTGFAVEKWDVSTGKRVWSRDVVTAEERHLARVGVPHPEPIPSPDGKTFALAVPRQFTEPGSVRADFLGSVVQVFDTATGEDGPVKLADQTDYRNEPAAYSRDGRLLAGWTVDARGGSGAARLVVWDTRTGKVLKGWEGGSRQRVTFGFAPDLPVLAVVEQHLSSEQGGTSTLALWDVSMLVKE
jgi:RNA polymerase sigma factor (sigma-70 family)